MGMRTFQERDVIAAEDMLTDQQEVGNIIAELLKILLMSVGGMRLIGLLH